jgi:hypothetical protein
MATESVATQLKTAASELNEADALIGLLDKAIGTEDGDVGIALTMIRKRIGAAADVVQRVANHGGAA